MEIEHPLGADAFRGMGQPGAGYECPVREVLGRENALGTKTDQRQRLVRGFSEMGNGMCVGSEVKPQAADQVIDLLVNLVQLGLDPFQGPEQGFPGLPAVSGLVF